MEPVVAEGRAEGLDDPQMNEIFQSILQDASVQDPSAGDAR
jgi:hypothetical protein